MTKHLINSKIRGFIVVLVCLCLTPNLNAHTGSFFQTTTITLKVKNQSVREVLNLIEKETDVRFSFKVKDIDLDRKVNINVKDKSIDKLLKELFKGTEIGVIKNDNNYFLVKVTRSKNVFQKVTISGKIIDEVGNPLPGVYVVIKNTNNGTSSDMNGEYSINVKLKDTLVYSFLGYKTVEKPIISGQKIDVQMTPAKAQLDEVVLTGIFQRKKESFTGSSITLDKEDLQRVGNRNVFSILENIDPSISLADQFDLGSSPNAVPDIKIRGTSTFPADNNQSEGFKGNYLKNPNEPLFILNGFEVSAERIFDLDFNRIKRLSVLKDAASKALYGSKASNGVIVIETDPITGEDSRVTYTANLDVEIPDLSSYHLTNSLQKLQAEKLDGFYLSRDPETFMELQQLYNSRLKLAKEGLNTDWMSLPLRNSIGHRHNINVELGSEKLRVLANLNYRKNTGAMKGSYRKDFGGSVTTMYNIKHLKFKNMTTVISNSQKESPYGSFTQYTQMNPYWSARNPDGTIPYYAEDIEGNSKVTNPLYDTTLKNRNDAGYFDFTNNFYLEWQILNHLTAKVRTGIEVKRSKADEFHPGNSTEFENVSDVERRGSYTVNNGMSSDFSTDLNLQYSKNFRKHFVFANVGTNVAERKYEELRNTAEGFPGDKLDDITFARGYALDSRPVGIKGVSRELGFLGVGSYVYDDRFMTDLTLRASASSQFGNDSKWATFWSAGIGWNLHNEKFLEKSSFIKRLKIRGSVGSTGNQNFNSNQSIVTYKYFQDNFYQGHPGSYINNMGNPNLQWESKMDYNVGLDAEIENLQLRFDYYISDTKNLVTDITLPPSNGFQSVKENLGKVRNTGIEVNATYKIWSQGNNFISANFGISTNKNKIIDLSNAMKGFNDAQDKVAEDIDNTKPVHKYEDGQSLNAIFVVPSRGIDPGTGREVFVKRDGSTTYNWDPNDMVVLGESEPRYRGVIGLYSQYEGFGLNLTGRFLGGGQIYNQTLVDRVENVDIRYNVDERVLTGRWKKPGQITSYKGLRYYDYNTDSFITKVTNYTRPTSRFVQNRKEFTISSINFYYEFKRKMVRKFGLERLRLDFTMNDIATFSSVRIERGLSYPFTRKMSFTLTASL